MGTDVELGQIGNTKTWPVCSSEYSLAFSGSGEGSLIVLW